MASLAFRLALTRRGIHSIDGVAGLFDSSYRTIVRADSGVSNSIFHMVKLMLAGYDPLSRELVYGYRWFPDCASVAFFGDELPKSVTYTGSDGTQWFEMYRWLGEISHPHRLCNHYEVINVYSGGKFYPYRYSPHQDSWVLSPEERNGPVYKRRKGWRDSWVPTQFTTQAQM